MIKYFVIRNFRGTCSSVEILKGYMLSCWNAEGVYGKRKAGNSWSSLTPLIVYIFIKRCYACSK